MRTLAESFGFRPTKFMPNGCGPGGWLNKLVPDAVLNVEFDDCCDLHDLGYHVGRGGWHGVFWAKPLIDIDLMQCMDRHFSQKIAWLQLTDRPWQAHGLFAVGVVVPIIYFIGLTLLGWTPLTWPWRQRPMPSHEDLEKLKGYTE